MHAVVLQSPFSRAIRFVTMGSSTQKVALNGQTTFHPREHEQTTPGRGSIKPRSWNVHSDSSRLSLNGTWKFKYSTNVPFDESFAEVDGVKDKKWDSTPVPSHWVFHGYGKPAYQNIQFPFPVDPPIVPDENPTGDYRHTFDLPKTWKLDSGKVSRVMTAADCRPSCDSMGSSRGRRSG